MLGNVLVTSRVPELSELCGTQGQSQGPTVIAGELVEHARRLEIVPLIENGAPEQWRRGIAIRVPIRLVLWPPAEAGGLLPIAPARKGIREIPRV